MKTLYLLLDNECSDGKFRFLISENILIFLEKKGLLEKLASIPRCA
jgi:hypothetical protein